MLCAFRYNQTLVHPITTRGASNISPVSHPQLAMPPWAGPRGSLALLLPLPNLLFWSSNEFPLNPSLWLHGFIGLVEEFPCIRRQTADRFELKFGVLTESLWASIGIINFWSHPTEDRHGWGQSWKSQCGSNILSTHIPFVPCQSTLPFRDTTFSRFDLENPRWRWNDKYVAQLQV